VQLASTANEEKNADSVGSGGVAVASLLLERYARSLKSAALLQLSRARLGLTKLKSLWQRIRKEGMHDSVGKGHDAETIKWCMDFQQEIETQSHSARSTETQAAASLAAAHSEHQALEQEVAARQQILQTFSTGADNLQVMLGLAQTRGNATLAMLQSLRSFRSNTETRARIDQTLGQIEAFTASGDAEVQDIIGAAVTRRADVERGQRASIAKAQARIAALVQEEVTLAITVNASDVILSSSVAASTVKDENLRKHYEQICRWTLENIQARRHQEEGERDAIRAALAVMSAH